jgi:hypothetical protein
LLSEFCFNKQYIQPFKSFKLEEKLENRKLLNMLFDKVGDNTARLDLLSKLRNKIIISVAKKFKCALVLLNDISIDLAAEIVSNTVLGKGANINYHSFFRNKKYSKIQFLYPMQNFTQIDVFTYLKFYNCTNIELKQISVENHELSIQNITKKFLLKFDNNSSFDTSTICSVNKKMCLYNSNILQFHICKLCYRLVNSAIILENISTLFAKKFSKFISNFGTKSKTKKSMNEFSFDANFYFYKIFSKNLIESYSCMYHLKKSDQTVFVCYACAVLLYKYLI